MKVLAAGTLIFFAFILQFSLLGNFSNGPEAIINVPLAIMFYVIFSIIAGTVIAKSEVKLVKIISYIVALFINSLIIAVLHPTDGGIKPHVYLIKSIQAGKKYDSIEYNDIYLEGEVNEPLKKIAIEKFKNNLPEKSLMVHYYKSNEVEWENRERIVFELQNHKWKSINLTNNNIYAKIDVGRQMIDGKESKVYFVTLNNYTFLQKYYPPAVGQIGYFQELRNRPSKADPRITMFEWDF